MPGVLYDPRYGHSRFWLGCAQVGNTPAQQWSTRVRGPSTFNHPDCGDERSHLAPPVEILGLVLLAAIAWLIWDSLKAREAAVVASRAACAAEQLQFLDDTVMIQSVRPMRNDEGNLRLRRVYGFEYSESGDNRRKGSVVMVGDRVIVLNLELPPRVTSLPLH